MVYPDADAAPAGYVAFPKSWDAAHGPLPSYVLLRRANDTNERGRSFILRTRGGNIPWDAAAARPPRVAISESVFAEISAPGEQRGVAVTFHKAGVRTRVTRRLNSWWSTGWVLPTIELLPGGGTAVD